MKSETKVLSFIVIISLVLGCRKTVSEETVQAQRVETMNPKVVSRTLRLPMNGMIKQSSAPKTGLRNFMISIVLPKNVTPKILVADNLEIELPLLAGAKRKANVVSILGQQIQLALNNEIHDLAGQVARVQIPASAQSIFEVPVAAIFSPMGHKAYIFSVKEKMVKQVEVDVLNPTENGNLLIASSELKADSQIVVNGLDNLIDGDLVQNGDINDRK